MSVRRSADYEAEAAYVIAAVSVPELQRRIQTCAAGVAKLYRHAGRLLKTLERIRARQGEACDQVVRRLCRSVWGFKDAKLH